MLSKKDSDLLTIFDWMALDERAFHDYVRARVLENGNVGDAFPLMVAYNVPFYLLRNFWPERWEQLLRNPVYMAFAAAEAGWQGRTDNISSRCSDGRVRFEKSYVISCRVMLTLVKSAREQELALAWVPVSDSFDVRSRNEAGVTFQYHVAGTSSPNDTVTFDHHFVSGTAELPAADLLTLHRKKYARAGLEIPRRELTTMATLAAAFARYHGWFSADEEADLIAPPEEAIVTARVAGRIRSEQLRLAGGLVDRVLERAAERGFALGPFWEVIRRFRARVIVPPA